MIQQLLAILFNGVEIYSHVTAVYLCLKICKYIFALHHLLEITGHFSNILGYVIVPTNLIQMVLMVVFNATGILSQFTTVKEAYKKKMYLLIPVGCIDIV